MRPRQVGDPVEIAMIAAAAAGACVTHCVGDVGSLGLGALIGGLAVATRTTRHSP